MSHISPGNYSIVDHLLDTCDSLLAACRELQQAKLPATSGPPPIDLVKSETDGPRTAALRMAEAGEKYKHIDVLVDDAIDAPREWHPAILEPWQLTDSGYQRVVTRLHTVAARRGVKVQTTRYLDTGDDGSCVHVKLRTGGAK